MKQKATRRRLGLILAGGLSKRLFPLDIPKPLLRPTGAKTLLEAALGRLKGFETYVVVNQEIAAQIRRYFRSIHKPCPRFLIEPEGRDTAAAVGFGLTQAPGRYEWVAVLSADQWMPDSQKFSKFLKVVEGEVRNFPDALFVAGSPAKSKPVESHSSFGWVIPQGERGSSCAVEEFIEKPVGARLLKMRKSGGLINAGMFFGRFETFVEAYVKHYPFLFREGLRYTNLPRMPVDRAIFEKFENVRVMRLGLRWEDLGTWQDWNRNKLIPSWWGMGPKLRVKGDPGNFVVSENLREIFIIGSSDLAVIEKAGRLLVMPLEEAKNLKSILEAHHV